MCLFRTQQDVSHFNSSFLELPFICVPQEKRVQLLVTFYKQLVHSTFRHGEKWCHFILPVWITTPTGPRNKWTHNHQFYVFSTSLRKQLHKGNKMIRNNLALQRPTSLALQTCCRGRSMNVKAVSIYLTSPHKKPVISHPFSKMSKGRIRGGEWLS